MSLRWHLGGINYHHHHRILTTMTKGLGFRLANGSEGLFTCEFHLLRFVGVFTRALLCFVCWFVGKVLCQVGGLAIIH